MADFVLNLGGVAFQDFEVPDDIRGGGDQAFEWHKYPGGTRTVDAMGPDDDDLRWSGYFEGPSALTRCQMLDTMRRQGEAVALTWSAYSYIVVIKRFRWKFMRYYHYSYEIDLFVVQDLSNPAPQQSPSVEQQIQNDIGDALTDAAALA
jgi:hypothetical protein